MSTIIALILTYAASFSLLSWLMAQEEQAW